MVNTRTSKSSAAAEGSKKPTSRPKTLTKASVVKGETLKTKKAIPTAHETVMSTEIQKKAVDSTKVLPETAPDPVLEKESTVEGENAQNGTLLIEKKQSEQAKTPVKGVSPVNPKGTSSESIAAPSRVNVGVPSGKESLVTELVKKGVADSVVGDQVVVGGGSISIADLVARIQAELLANLAREQQVREEVRVGETEKVKETDQAEQDTAKNKEQSVKIVEASVPASAKDQTIGESAGADSQSKDEADKSEEKDDDSDELFGLGDEQGESDPVEVTGLDTTNSPVVSHKASKDTVAESVPEDTPSEEESEKESGEDADEESVPEAVQDSVQASVPGSEKQTDQKSVPAETSDEPDELSPIAKLKKDVKQGKKRSAAAKLPKSSKKVKFNAKPTTVQGSLIKGVWFSSKDHAAKWALIQHRSIVAEKVINVKKYPGILVDLLSECKMLGSLRKAGKFSEKLVREVIVNLPAQFGVEGSEQYGQLRVRGKAVYLTPELINVCLDAPQWAAEAVPEDLNTIVREITQGVKVHWKGANFKASDLSTKYSFLYQIAHYNWMSSTHRGTVTKDLAKLIYAVGMKKRVNLGELVFAHLEKHSVSDREQLPIGFPALIHRLVLEQFPDILMPGEALSVDPKVLAMDHKLFAGSRVIDVPSGASVQLPETIQLPVSIHKKFAKEVRGQISFLESEIKRMQVQRAQLQDLLADLGSLSAGAPEVADTDSEEE